MKKKSVSWFSKKDVEVRNPNARSLSLSLAPDSKPRPQEVTVMF